MSTKFQSTIRHGRQVGNTTRQMQLAPKNAVFVWINHQLHYPRELAAKIGREDLEIVSPDWLSDNRWAGRTFSAIAVDHAASLTDSQWDALLIVRDTRVRN